MKIMNDACMQALGSYEGGRMLFIGLGTSMGSVYMIDGKIIPLALGHLMLYKGETFEHRLSRSGFERSGLKRWLRAVSDTVPILKAAFLADYVMIGGGQAKKIEQLPEGSRRGSNEMAYVGGVRMWEEDSSKWFSNDAAQETDGNAKQTAKCRAIRITYLIAKRSLIRGARPMATKTKKTRKTKKKSRGKAKPHQKGSDKKWSGKVKTVSTYPPEGLYTKDGETIARVMATKKVSPKGLGSAIRMVQFFINRAGKTLPKSRLQELEKAKKILQSKRDVK